MTELMTAFTFGLLGSAHCVGMCGGFAAVVGATSRPLSRLTVRTIKLNLFWAFSYNAIGIPLAMTGRLSPIFAALAMVISSLIVVTNSLKLRETPIEAPA